MVNFVMTALLAALTIPPDANGPDGDSLAAHGAYSTGIYPDLFVSLLNRKPADVMARVDTVFNQLFFGDDSTQRVYYPVGADMAYVEDIANNDVRTEGMSYGMMIAAQLNRKDVFDRLWTWAKAHMYLPTGAHRGYFAWHCRTDGTILDSTTASDGEEWFVMSLFFASARWGDGQGIYDYRGEAQQILSTMLNKNAEHGHGNVTDMFNRDRKLVVFVPKIPGNQFTDPSYQLPHYYELWGRWAGADNRFWCDAASAGRMLLRHAADPATGLSPDYSDFDGKPLPGWRGGHDDFRFDAWRVAMNVAVDWVWFGKERWEISQSDLLLDFFRSRGLRTYGNQFTLAGRQLSKDHSPGLVAANAVAALASTRADGKDFVAEFWNTPVPTGFYRYYDGMLYMLGMLQVSGNFRIYAPNGPTNPACDE